MGKRGRQMRLSETRIESEEKRGMGNDGTEVPETLVGRKSYSVTQW